MEVSYTLTSDNRFVISYRADSDEACPLNFSNHSIFNLKGEGNGTILDHELTIFADATTPVDSVLIPTGEISHLLAEGMCGRSVGPSRRILRHGKNDLRLLSVHLPRPAEVPLTVQRDLDVRTGDSVPDGCQRLGGLAVRSDGNGVFHHTCQGCVGVVGLHRLL